MKLNILSHPVHPSWEYEFSKLKHNVFLILPEEFEFIGDTQWKKSNDCLFKDILWDINQRPLPQNFHFISLKKARELIKKNFFNLFLVHTVKYLEKLKYFALRLPTILHFHTIAEEKIFLPQWVLKLNIFFTFNSKLAAQKVVVEEKRKFVIPPPVDFEIFNGYVGDISRCLTVNPLIKWREEKSYNLIQQLSMHLKLDVLGGDSENLELKNNSQGIGEAFGLNELLFFYRHWAVYCDVNNHLSLSLIEAMAVGMPVVILARNEVVAGYQGEFFKDNFNCLIANNIDEMVKKTKFLLNNFELRKKIGSEARKTAQKIYDANNFRLKWQNLLKKLKLKN